MIRSIGAIRLAGLVAIILMAAAAACSRGEPTPPCTTDDVPCSSRDVSGAHVIGNELQSGAAFGLQIDPPSAEEVLEKGPDALGLSPVHPGSETRSC